MPDSGASILAGVDKIIDTALGLKDIGKRPFYKHKESCQRLSAQQFDGGKTFVAHIYEQVEANWDKRPSRSSENWRDIRQGTPSSDGKKLEVTLERRIVGCPWPASVRWFNQVPVASGLANSVRDKKRAIDLVHVSEMNNGWYEFIELKVAQSGGTPLLAAMEILQYGVLYIFSRKNARNLGYDINEKPSLKAPGIRLLVLAPATYYDEYRLGWLKDKINDGVRYVLTEKNIQVELNFDFQAFPSTFDPRSLPDDLAIMRALNARSSVY